MGPTSFRPDVFEVDPPALLGSSCAACSRRAFPRRDVCPHCAAVGSAEPVRLSTRGRVYSFTIVRQAPPGLATPYVLAYVDLPQDEVRVMARIETGTPDAVSIGQPVTLVGRRDELAADEGTVMFAFAPDDAQEAPA